MTLETIDAPFPHQQLEHAVAGTEPTYLDVQQFLHREAALLDNDRFEEWLEFLADDLVYWMPVRVNRVRDDGQGFSTGMGFFDDTKASIAHRIERFTRSKAAWAEDPPSRVRRMVTNLLVYRTPMPDEVIATSYVLLVRNRVSVPFPGLITCERQDLLRRTDAGWRIARREIFVDQAPLAVQNLAVFI
jgi:3-phenylpropionate/cinnamic acid dioxygenase small subunit